MNQTIRLRRSATPGNVPTTGELNLGELAINTNDGRLFTLKSVSGSLSVVEFLNAASATDLYVDVAGDTMTGALLVPDGSVGAPSFSFSSDPDTGIFRATAGMVSLATSGIEAIRFGQDFALLPDGSAGAPGISFFNDTNTGMYRVGSGDILGFSVGGSTMLQIDNGSSVTVIAPMGIQGVLSVGTITTSNFQVNASNIALFATGRNIQLRGSNVTVSATNTVFLSAGSSVDIQSGDLTLSGSGQIILPKGSAAAPAIVFTTTSNPAGMFFDPSTSSITFMNQNAARLRIGGNFVESSTQFRAATDVASSVPGYSFSSDTDTGLMLDGAGNLSLIHSASSMLRVLAGTGVTVRAPLDIAVGDLTLSGCGQILLANGSVGAPGVAFASNTDTGIYRQFTNQLSFAAAGAQALRLGGGQVLIGTNGTTSAPSLAFASSSQSGWKQSFGIVTLCQNNASTITYQSDRIRSQVPFHSIAGSAGAPTYTFDNDTDTGMFSDGIEELSFSAGGSTMLRLDNGSSVTVLAPLHLTNGSVGGPGLTFAADSDTGWYSQVSNQWSFISGGVHAFRMGVGNDVIFSSTQNISLQNGTAAAPTFTFAADSDTGMYRATTNTIGFVAAGETQFKITDGFLFSSNATIQTDFGTAAAPAYTFNGDPNVGIYRAAADNLGLAAAGSTIMSIVSSVISAAQPGTDLGANLGASTLRWNVVFASRISYTTLDPVPSATISFPLLASPLGSAGGPAYSFEGDTDTGMYRDNINRLSFAASGVEIMRLAGSQILIRTNGSAGAPALAFGSSTNTGWTRTSGTLSTIVNGASTLIHRTSHIQSHQRFQVPFGTATSPSYTFEGFNSAGMFVPAGGLLGFSVSGSQMIQIDNGSSVTIIAPLVTTGQIRVPGGTSVAPSYSFTSDPDTGMFQSGTGQLQLAASSDIYITLNNHQIVFPFGSAGAGTTAPTLTFVADQDTGIAHLGGVGNQMAMVAGGSTLMKFASGSSITAFIAIHPGTTNTYNLGASTLRWNAMFASRVSATDLEGSLADVAERYSADKTDYEAGTVMVFGGPEEIMECYQMNDTRVAGVISEKPFIKMNAKAGPDDTHPYLALKGRIGCKIKGSVSKGDLVTTSDKRGYGQVATEITPAWAVFAKSLEDSMDASAIITVVVQ